MKSLLLLIDSDRIVGALVHTSATVKALLDIDHCDIIDSYGSLRAYVHASTASNAFILVDLGRHQNTSDVSGNS